jgi:hypothetical protein
MSVPPPLLLPDEPARRVREFLRHPDPTRFEPLALTLFAHQFEHNPPYRRFASHLNRTPATVTRWQDIPAVPTRAFKMPAHPLAVGSPGPVTFLTSGTTGESQGTHHFPNTSLYDLSIDLGWPLPSLPTYFLAPGPSETPHSSLAHMFARLNSGDSSRFLLREGKFHLGPLFARIASDQPLFLMGTALAFLHLMDHLGPLPLPAGSHLLETGGYKGTSRTLAKVDLYEQLSSFFHLPPDHLHNEYGMTELSSQAYATGPAGTHRFPPWCRHLVLQPETNQPVSVDETGYLLVHDLANAHSVAAIQTQDFAIPHSDGSFTLLGRDPGALPRGCSRLIDESLSS